MKIIKITAFLIVFFTINCEYSNNKQKSYSSNADTIFLQETCVLSFELTEKKINDLKRKYENENDFYIITDDANFYSNKAFEYLKMQKINIIDIKGDKILNFNNNFFLDAKTIDLWDILFYKKNGIPITVKPINVEYLFSSYFYCNFNELSDDCLKNWYDIYYFVPFSEEVISENLGHKGSYYIQINKDKYSDFATSFGDEDVSFNYKIIPKCDNDTLYILSNENHNLLAKIIKVGNDYYMDSELIKVFTDEIQKTQYGYKVNKGFPDD
jgi:hypothetical protein